MFASNSRLFTWGLVWIVVQLSVDGISAQLQRPTRPEKFSSPEEVLKYVNAVRQHIRLTSPRFGKRTLALGNEAENDEGAAEMERIQGMRNPMRGKSPTMGEVYQQLYEINQLPTEWQQMSKLQSAPWSALPLRLLPKYLHLNLNTPGRTHSFSAMDHDDADK